MTKFRYMQKTPKDLNFVNLLTNVNNKKIKIYIGFVLLRSIAMGNLQETKRNTKRYCLGSSETTRGTNE